MPPSTNYPLDSTLFNHDFYTSILCFWLSTYSEPSSNFTQTDVIRWFAPSTAIDQQVHALAYDAISSIGPNQMILPPFTSLEADQDLYDEIAAPFIPHLCGANDDNDHSAHAALALSILLDQFPRNLFRGAAQAVVYTHYDRLSRALSSQLPSLGRDSAESHINSPVWRLWLYMPLEHSESLADHELFRTILSQMLESAKNVGDEMGVKFVEKAIEFEKKHLEPLQEFGRFPWRNKWLGRDSTAAERKYMEERDDIFGAG